MAQDGVFVYPDAGRGNNGTDLLAAAALMGNGGFGGMNNPLWMMFMWPMLYPMMSMFGGFGGFGGWNNAFNGNGYVATQLNTDAGREVILQAINGRADALGQLAQITNTSVGDVRDAICTVNAKLSEVGGQIGMTGMQVINAIQNGDANIARQLCDCCCENRLAIANQTATLQADSARNFAATQLQLAQNEAANQLSVCQQTNAITRQADSNTNSILSAIASQNTMIAKGFSDIKERELQSKIDTQADIITQLRGQLDNDRQTNQLFAAINPLQAKVNEIANKQPNTVPVQWPNLTAVNNTPNVGFGYGYGYGCNNSFWG